LELVTVEPEDTPIEQINYVPVKGRDVTTLHNAGPYRRPADYL
jgi:hypothetical protein